MQRSVPLLKQLQRAGAAAVDAGSTRSFTSVGSFNFSSLQDAPVSSLGSAINVSVKTSGVGKGKANVEVSASAGRASAKAKYTSAELRKAGSKPLALVEVARISPLHSSFMDYLLQLAHERYAVLAKFPDFTTMYGKDYYYRVHPDDLKKFYSMVDEFHRMYDVVTEFDSLSGLAAELVPGYRNRRMNTVHPGVGPTTANAAVTQFLLSHAK